MKKSFSVLLVVTILCTMLPVSLLAPNNVNAAIVEVPRIADYDAPQDSQPFQTYPIPINDEGNEVWNTYPIDEWYVDDDPVSFFSPDVTEFVPERIEFERVYEAGLRVNINPSIYMPGATISVSWELENFTSGFDNHSYYLQFYSNDLSELPGSTLFDNELSSLSIEELSGNFQLHKTNTDEANELSFNLSLYRDGELLDVQQVVLPVADNNTESANLYGNLNGQVQIENFNLSNGLENLIFSANRPSPHKTPSYSLQGMMLEILAVDPINNVDINSFIEPVKITIPYNSELFSDEQEADLQLYYFNEADNEWYPMATTVDTETKTLSVFTDHLTVFDYKASNWQAYLPPLLQSYEVSEFTGAANYTYQIPTIAAEGGIRPELALRYNSQIIDEGAYFTQASWVGMGWSLDTGAITRDMHETPSSLNDDTFFLNLNGISGRLLPVSTTGEYTEYRLQQDSSHRIRQYGDQSWVVFGNNGVNYHFENQQSSNAYYAANSCADLQIWKWMLTRIVDANGNTIIYENEKGQKTYEKNSATCTIDHSIYPKSIKYSPVSGGGYKYQINFVTDTRVDYKESWNENSSATFFDKVKLNKVELLINNQPYRDYLLTYSNLILPAINWNGADTPTLALAVIKEVGHYGSQSLYTPALSFEYKDKLHLSKIDNNQGGKVEFGYTPHEEYIDSHKGPRSVQWDRLTGCQYLGSHPWLHRHRENGVLCQDENLDDGTMYELTFLPAPSEPSPKDSALLTASIPETMLKYGGKYRFAFIGRSVSDNGTGTDLGFKCKMPRKLDVINFYVGTNSTSMGFTLELDTEWDITTTDFYTESTGLRISLLEIVLYPGRYVVTSRTETDYSDSNNPNSVTWDYEYEGFAYNNPQNSPSSDADKLYVPHYREFRGFSKATQTLQGENLKIISYFDQRDRTKGNLLKREVILNNMLYQTSTYEYQTHDSIVLINNDALAKASLRQFIDLDIYWNRLVSEKHTIHPNGNVNNLYGTETRFSYNGCAYNDPACENNMARDDFKAQLTRKASYVFKTSGNPEPFLIDFINYQTPGFFNVSEHSNAPTGRQHWHSTRVDSIEARKVDATTLLRKTLYFYDNQGNLITQRVLQDGGNYAQTSYSYNDTGDLVTERSWKEPSSFNSDPQGAAIVVGYSYDPAFPGQVYQQTIGAGSQNQLTTTTFYDLRNNLPIKVQHPNGAIEGAAYDPLGRIIKICAQDNWNPEVQTCADVERPTLGVTYRNYHRETNQPMSILLDPFDGSDIHHYYNGFGKLIQTQTRHAHLSASETTNFVSYAARYDGLGRLIYESNAFDIGAHGYSYYHLDFPSMPDGVRQYSYDPLGRLLSIQRISSASSPRLEKKFDYQFFADSQRNEWLSVSIESDARDQAGGWQYATKTRTNALGQVVNVIPPTGPSTRFVYDALGQLLEAYYGNAKTTMTYDYAGNKISMKDPDMGYWVYGYNYNGSLSVQIDGNNQKTCLSYDSINRLISKSFGNHPSSCDSLSPSIQYRYDENGQLGYRTGMTDASGTTAWKYDLRGRMIREDKTVGSFGAFTTQWAYDSADRVIAMLYPDGERVDFSYLPQGGVNRVGAYLTGTQVNANGQISLRTFGNGTQTSLTYNDWLTNGGRLSALQSGQSASLLNLGFTYDSVGNILTITDALNSNQVQSFTYDALNRLTAASTNGVGQGQYAQNYGYDPATGNLASKSDVGAYSYSPAKPHAVAQAGANSYVYDQNGNMTSRTVDGVVWTYAYNAENQLISTHKDNQLISEYGYDGDGKRVAEINADGTATIFIGNYFEGAYPEPEPPAQPPQPSLPFKAYLPIVSKGGISFEPITARFGTLYFYADGERIAMKKDGEVYYLYGDQLGSVSAVADADGNQISKTLYHPWGTIRHTQGTSPTDYAFTGQMKEGDIYFYNARWYDPAIGRFMQADTLVPPTQGTQGFDRFAYVNNNPLIYTDPSGNWLIPGWDDKYILNQGQTNRCAIFSLAMASSAVSEMQVDEVKLEQAWIWRKLGLDWGIPPTLQPKGVNNTFPEIEAEYLQGNKETIISLLEQGNPVVVTLAYPKYGHSVVAIGYEPLSDELIFVNPAGGNRRNESELVNDIRSQIGYFFPNTDLTQYEDFAALQSHSNSWILSRSLVVLSKREQSGTPYHVPTYSPRGRSPFKPVLMQR